MDIVLSIITFQAKRRKNEVIAKQFYYAYIHSKHLKFDDQVISNLEKQAKMTFYSIKYKGVEAVFSYFERGMELHNIKLNLVPEQYGLSMIARHYKIYKERLKVQEVERRQKEEGRAYQPASSLGVEHRVITTRRSESNFINNYFDHISNWGFL